MINTLEKSARTVDAAIEEALKELRMSRDDVSVEILDMGKTGFLGFGAQPARVRGCAFCARRETCTFRKGGHTCGAEN